MPSRSARRPPARRRGSEDCLTLNILRQAEPSTAPRPVMVYIHGGAHTAGTSAAPMYSGASLVRRGDVVFRLSLGYRLGALGYLDFASSPRRKHFRRQSRPA